LDGKCTAIGIDVDLLDVRNRLHNFGHDLLDIGFRLSLDLVKEVMLMYVLAMSLLCAGQKE
jgi:hypothetical protein